MPRAIVMIGGGIQEVPAVKQVQDMGYQCIVTDRNPRAPAFRDADWRIPESGDSYHAILHLLRNLMRDEDVEVVGVFTLTELFYEVSRVAHELG